PHRTTGGRRVTGWTWVVSVSEFHCYAPNGPLSNFHAGVISLVRQRKLRPTTIGAGIPPQATSRVMVLALSFNTACKSDRVSNTDPPANLACGNRAADCKVV